MEFDRRERGEATDHGLPMKRTIHIAGIFIAAALATVVSVHVTGADRDDVTQPGRYSVLYEGPELRASVGYRQATQDLGDEWLLKDCGDQPVKGRRDVRVFGWRPEQ